MDRTQRERVLNLIMACSVAAGLAGFILGLVSGAELQNRTWRQRLIEHPGHIAVIRSQLLAEREADRLRELADELEKEAELQTTTAGIEDGDW